MLQSHSHELNHGRLAPNLKVVSLTLIEHPVVKKEMQQNGEKLLSCVPDQNTESDCIIDNPKEQHVSCSFSMLLAVERA